jgi:hypothetical protein
MRWKDCPPLGAAEPVAVPSYRPGSWAYAAMSHQTGILDFMDQYTKSDHATLVRNLNAVCKGLGRVIDSAGLYCGPPALTHENVEEDIPLALHKIAVAAGWVEESVELGFEDFDQGRGEFLGNVVVEESYREWFLGLVSETLADLKVRASANEAAQNRHFKWLTDQYANGTDSIPEWAASLKAAKVPETTPKERKDLEDKYRATYKHFHYQDRFLMKELYWMAVVHQKQWERWRRGEIDNNSQPGRRILALLEHNEQARKQKTLPPRSRE